MSRTVEQIFKNAYYVGTHYNRFRILIVAEYGPDFSASPSKNSAAFHEYLHDEYNKWILDAFDAAIKEVGISLGRGKHTEFFASYNYYWCNTRRLEINSDEKIYPEIYLSRLVEELDAGLVISAGVGDERFRRNEELPRLDISERPIYFEPSHDKETLKEFFMAYLINYQSGIDEAFDHLAEQIAKGKSPLYVFNDSFGANNSRGSGGSFNTYPAGTSSRLYPDLFVVCEDPMNLSEPFNYIDWWCRQTEYRFPRRRVILLTDKWTTEDYKRYENLFRRLAKQHAVKFEFYLYMLGALPSKIKLPF